LHLNISTNENTIEELALKKYSIFIHNTRNYKKLFFTFNKENTNYKIVIEKKELSKGIHIITIFNENNIPVLERLIFNEFEDALNTKLKIRNLKTTYDSTFVSVANTSNEKMYVSASFLPSKTKAYKPKHTIKSTLLLKPYLKGFIEKPQNYFYPNKNSRKNLDLLLLTQGWSKYNWSTIFNSLPSANFEFENGIDLELKTNKVLKPKQFLLMYSTDNNLIRTIPHNIDTYSLKNTFIKKNSTIDFAIRSNDNFHKITPVLTYSKNSLYESIDVKKFPKSKNIELQVSNFKTIRKGVVVLDNVVIKANKIKYDDKPYGGTTMLNAVKMEDLIISPGELVTDFLIGKRFGIDPNAIDLFIERRIPVGCIDGNDLITCQRRNVRVYLDGQEITASLWNIQNMYLDTIKQIYYGRDPGMFAEVIYIYTLSPKETTRKKAVYTEVRVPVGFSMNKEYYTPKYPSFLNETYANYGAIYWKPNIVIEANSKIEFSIPKNYQKEMRVFFEGISEKNTLISKENIIQLD
jgi:hypothetical protein